MAQNNPTWQKMVQNGMKWSEMFRKMVQMRPVIATPNFPTKNGRKLPKKNTKHAQKDTRMGKNGPNRWQKEVIFFYFLGHLV